MRFDRVVAYLQEHSGPFLVRLLTAIAVGVGIYVATQIAGRIVSKALHARSGRTKTIAPLARGLVMLVGSFVAIVMGLAQLGIDVTTVLAGAGVVGLAVGFGAQTLVKDCISGFFLIIDDVIEVGDSVEIEGRKGTIERVGLRVTLLRTENGQLWYVPNGSIGQVGNYSRGYNRARVTLTLPFEDDLDEAIETIETAARAWEKDHPDLALDHPSVESVDFDRSSAGQRLLCVKIAVTVPAGASSQAEADLTRRLKRSLDEAHAHDKGTFDPDGSVAALARANAF